MKTAKQDTIYALASGHLPSGIAVMRISGPHSRFVLETMCGTVGAARQVRVTKIVSSSGELLDRGLAIWFPGPGSFTGEDYVELHLHGGRAVVGAVSEALSRIASLRPADAGEFTMRAFVNGKVDLTGAEALADLVDAETAEQRRFALFNAGAAHSDLYESWRAVIVDILAEMTADIDFADEADVGEGTERGHAERLNRLSGEIDSHMKQFRSGEIIREGFRVAILGEPNVGKSTLVNVLAGRDVAIVTDMPGTTRDVIEVSLDLGGRKVVVFDTAGIRDSQEPAEQIGVGRAIEYARNSDLIIWLYDVGRSSTGDMALDLDAPLLKVANKIDTAQSGASGIADVVISAKRNVGIDALIDILANAASEAVGSPSVIPFRLRHVSLLKEARDAINEVAGRPDLMIEIRAEILRHAGESLGKIAGKVDVEELLDVIFSRFCIGK